jgi:hypothetical protein
MVSPLFGDGRFAKTCIVILIRKPSKIKEMIIIYIINTTKYSIGLSCVLLKNGNQCPPLDLSSTYIMDAGREPRHNCGSKFHV